MELVYHKTNYCIIITGTGKEKTSNCEKSRFLFTYKERDAETGWDNLGARLYDSDVCRFFGVDPIADQFPHVNSYNYAENEPVANIDLHGLQRFYGADGSLLGKYGDSQEERVVHRPDDAIKVQKVLIEGTSIQKKMFMPEFLSSKFRAELFRAEDLNSAYDMFAIKYKNNTDKEYAMSVFEGLFIDDRGESFSGYQLGSIVWRDRNKHGGASVNIGDSKIPGYGNFWKLHSAIHTHPYGDVGDFSGIDKNSNGGPRYGFGVTNDLGWSIHFNVPILLAVPSKSEIAKFDPKLYNKYMSETGASQYKWYERNPQIRRAITYRKIGE